MAPLYSAQADRIRGLLQTTAIQCQIVASQQEPFSVCQMEEIRKLLEATATQCGAVSDHLSSPEDIVSWTLGCQSFFDQDQPLYIDANDPGRYLTANECRKLVRQLVAGLQHYGLENGDCVCVVNFNEIHYTSLYLGIIGSGGCFSGGNPGYTAYELIHHVRTSEAKFLFTSLATLDITLSAAQACGIPSKQVFVLNFNKEEIPEDQQSWECLLAHGESDWVKIDDPDNTPAAHVSTSGTSGLPKSAIVPHSYLVAQAEYQVLISSSVPYKLSTLVAIPPFHVFMIPIQHALPLRNGSPTYIMPRFHGPIFIEALQKYEITHTVVVPPILMALSKCSMNDLQCLRRVYTGGSCATDGMQNQLYVKLSSKARIVQVYGMTEVGWACTTWSEDSQERTGSVGSPVPNTTLRLVDNHGVEIHEDNTKGEIQIKAQHPMKGYLNNPLETNETFTSDGYVRSGDIGYVQDGKWYVIDRTKDLIKVRGWQVSPAEIEASLLEHSAISDAAVIGVPAGEKSGEEIPIAYVVRNTAATIDASDVKTFLAGRLSRFKEVKDVRFVESIPRNPTGKILRRVLREKYAAE